MSKTITLEGVMREHCENLKIWLEWFMDGAKQDEETKLWSKRDEEKKIPVILTDRELKCLLARSKTFDEPTE